MSVVTSGRSVLSAWRGRLIVAAPRIPEGQCRRTNLPRGHRALVAIGLALSMIGSGGCKFAGDPTPPPVDLATSHEAEAQTVAKVRRVVVPPFQDLTGFPREAEQTRQAFLRALGRRQRFELIPLGETELREVLPRETFQSGTIAKDMLISAARRYRADGVLFGVVTHYRPYDPLVLGLKLEMASADTGAVVWATSGLYDAATLDVTQDVHNYHDTQLAGSSSLEGWRLILMSPSRFTDYACARLAATLK